MNKSLAEQALALINENGGTIDDAIGTCMDHGATMTKIEKGTETWTFTDDSKIHFSRRRWWVSNPLNFPRG